MFLLAGVLIKKGEENNIEQNVNLPEEISAPINEGDKLGEISYSLNGETIATIDVIAQTSVSKIDLPHMLQYIFKSWIS